MSHDPELRRYRAAASSASLVLATFSVAFGALPAGAAPVVEQLVMERAQLGGREATVYALRTAQSAEQAARGWAHRWRDEGQGGVVLAVRDGWHVVSRVTVSGMQTVQFRDAGGGADGYRTEWGKKAAPQTIGALNWLTEGLEAIQTLRSSAGNKTASTWFATRAGSLDALQALLRERLLGRGFIADPLVAGRTAGAAAEVALYRRAGEDIVLSAAQRTDRAAVVIQHIRAH
jgi:hypothetical protein